MSILRCLRSMAASFFDFGDNFIYSQITNDLVSLLRIVSVSCRKLLNKSGCIHYAHFTTQEANSGCIQFG